MITSAKEFISLRQSDSLEEQQRAAQETANDNIWLDVMHNYPDYKIWIILNKTVSIAILELLAKDEESNVRSAVARKRKINEAIFQLLADDPDENVRYALICNTKLSNEKKKLIKVDDSQWLTDTLDKYLDK